MAKSLGLVSISPSSCLPCPGRLAWGPAVAAPFPPARRAAQPSILVDPRRRPGSLTRRTSWRASESQPLRRAPANVVRGWADPPQRLRATSGPLKPACPLAPPQVQLCQGGARLQLRAHPRHPEAGRPVQPQGTARAGRGLPAGRHAAAQTGGSGRDLAGGDVCSLGALWHPPGCVAFAAPMLHRPPQRPAVPNLPIVLPPPPAADGEAAAEPGEEGGQAHPGRHLQPQGRRRRTQLAAQARQGGAGRAGGPSRARSGMGA